MQNQFPVLIVTGLSGSGKSTALRVLEDLGFYCVDGMPAEIVPQMLRFFSVLREEYQGIVFGMDLRQPGFITEYHNVVAKLQTAQVTTRLLFLESSSDILIKRYATTRRPHPLEKEGIGLDSAIQREKERLQPLRNAADLVLDTSSFSVHDLRRALQERWQVFANKGHALRIHCITFGFKYGVPSEADIVLDLRFLPNPYFVEELRNHSGKEQIISDYVLKNTSGQTCLKHLQTFLSFMVQENEREGRFRMTVALGCTGGHHRSVAMGEALATYFREKGTDVTLEHRHLELE